MLAQVFNPTEIKKNGPARRPAIAPARRVAFLFNAGWVVLPGTAQNYCEADASSIDACRSGSFLRSRDEEHPRGQPSLFRSVSDSGPRRPRVAMAMIAPAKITRPYMMSMSGCGTRTTLGAWVIRASGQNVGTGAVVESADDGTARVNEAAATTAGPQDRRRRQP
jgi:hypothetical protein